MLFKQFPPRAGGRSRLLEIGRRLAGSTLAAILLFLPAHLTAQDVGVFLRVADPTAGTVDEISSNLASAIEGAGWTLLASYDAGVDPECTYRARVFVVDWPEHTQAVLSQGTHGAFAAPIRLAVYEDELGVHISAVNPRSLNRTIVVEEGMDDDWARFARVLRKTLTNGMGLTPAEGEFGQFRDKGRIGRTLGIMAGGPFQEKLKPVVTVEAGEGGVAALAQSVFNTLEAGPLGEDWGIRPIYTMNPAENVAIVGFTGEGMDSRSFSIVGKGSDKSRSDYACPGIDHAAAYPVEVVFLQEGNEINVILVDEMYRMKMFFEDAGKMSFARNMGMPGSIEDEIKDLVRSVLF